MAAWALLSAAFRAGADYGDARGTSSLREALAGYLATDRGVVADPSRLLIARGSQMALFLAVRAALSPGEVIAVEEPGYPLAWEAFRAAGAEVRGVPVDGGGLRIDVLEQALEREQLPKEVHERYLRFIKEYLAPRYVDFIGKEIQTAYLESYSEYGQNIFDRYVTYADFWIQDQEYRDPDTGEIFDRKSLNDELEKIEKPAGISNPKDFRNEVVNFVLRARANHAGKNPSWLSYEKLRTVIEKKMFSNTEDLLPVISFNPKASQGDQKKHEDFVKRMVERGYTEKQVRLLSEWYLRVRKSQ